MDFNQLIIDARPSLKPNSASAYATSLRLLAPEDAKTLDFLFDTDSMMKKLGKYKHTTRRNYLNAIIVVLKGGAEANDEHPEVKEALEHYETERDRYNEEYSEMVGTHQKTDRQKELWIEWTDFLAIVDSLRQEAEKLKAGEWSSKEKTVYQDYLIALLYSKYPLRNDFAHVKVITKKQYNGLSDGEKEQHNYIVKHDNNKYFLVLNEYKTRKNTVKKYRN